MFYVGIWDVLDRHLPECWPDKTARQEPRQCCGASRGRIDVSQARSTDDQERSALESGKTSEDEEGW